MVGSRSYSPPPIGQISSYLKMTGWSFQEDGRWSVFSFDASEAEAEIVLPDTESRWEKEAYATSAIETLAALNDNDPLDIAYRIVHQDRDVIRFRVLESDVLDLRSAAQELGMLEKLIRDTAANEYRPRPRYPTRRPKRAEEATESFQFGHTFNGSFGLTILSGVIYPPRQKDIFAESPEHVQLPPFTRRITERIMRGLIEVVVPEEISDDELARQYTSGLNANMFRRLSKLAGFQRARMNVIWSPRVSPSTDVARVPEVQIGPGLIDRFQRGYDVLTASKPIDTEISGKVIGLSSEDPLSDEEVHEITIKARHEERDIRVHLQLGKENYQLAARAHRQGAPVRVRGELSKSGSYFRLRNPIDFGVWKPKQDD